MAFHSWVLWYRLADRHYPDCLRLHAGQLRRSGHLLGRIGGGNMYCTKCGAPVPDDAIACPRCGCATKNFQPKNEQYPRRANGRASAQQPSAWKLVLGIFLLIFGASWFCTGIVSGRILALGLGVLALLVASALIAWDIMERKKEKQARMQDNEDFQKSRWPED